MEDTWNNRIPIECSTPKMKSQIGKEIEREMRRNSVSLATGLKRKSSPMESMKVTKQKYDSSLELHMRPYNWDESITARKDDDNEDANKDDYKDDVKDQMIRAVEPAPPHMGRLKSSNQHQHSDKRQPQLQQHSTK